MWNPSTRRGSTTWPDMIPSHICHVIVSEFSAVMGNNVTHSCGTNDYLSTENIISRQKRQEWASNGKHTPHFYYVSALMVCTTVAVCPLIFLAHVFMMVIVVYGSIVGTR
jgi:hypothetical protein